MSFKLKTLVTATLLLSSSIALAGQNYKDATFKDAAPCPMPPQLMDGWYVGIQGGYDVYDASVNPTGVGAGNSVNTNLNANGWVGGLMLGYGRYFNNMYYLAGEIFGNYSNADQTLNATFASAPAVVYNGKFTVDGSYGLAVLPGLKLSDSTLAYVRLGYNWARLKYQESAAGIGSVSNTNTEGGFVYGLGMETLLSGNWSVRGEYTYTNYSSFNTSMGAGSSTSINPSDNQFMVGVLYHFA